MTRKMAKGHASAAGVARSGYDLRVQDEKGGMTDLGEPIISGPGDGTTIEGPVGGPLTFKARGEQTNGSFTALENVIPPGQGPPLHTYAYEDEAWYVLEGELRFKLNNEVRASSTHLPRSPPHTLRHSPGSAALSGCRSSHHHWHSPTLSNGAVTEPPFVLR